MKIIAIGILGATALLFGAKHLMSDQKSGQTSHDNVEQMGIESDPVQTSPKTQVKSKTAGATGNLESAKAANAMPSRSVATNHEPLKGDAQTTSPSSKAQVSNGSESQQSGKKSLKTRLTEIRGPQDIKQFLEEVKLTDPAKAFRSARYIRSASDPIVRNLAGQHSGELTLSPTGQILKISVEYLPAEKDQYARGGLEIIISGGGQPQFKTYSPAIGQLTENTDSLEATVVAIDRNRYVQMYYLGQNQEWVANFYRTDPKTGNLVFAGTAKLRRSS